MPDDLPFSEIMTRIRRSVRNGERLHLEQAHIRVIVTSELWPALARLEAIELQEQWRERLGEADTGSMTGAERRKSAAQPPRESDPNVDSELVKAVTNTVLGRAKAKKRKAQKL